MFCRGSVVALVVAVILCTPLLEAKRAKPGRKADPTLLMDDDTPFLTYLKDNTGVHCFVADDLGIAARMWTDMFNSLDSPLMDASYTLPGNTYICEPVNGTELENEIKQNKLRVCCRELSVSQETNHCANIRVLCEREFQVLVSSTIADLQSVLPLVEIRGKSQAIPHVTGEATYILTHLRTVHDGSGLTTVGTLQDGSEVVVYAQWKPVRVATGGKCGGSLSGSSAQKANYKRCTKAGFTRGHVVDREFGGRCVTDNVNCEVALWNNVQRPAVYRTFFDLPSSHTLTYKADEFRTVRCVDKQGQSFDVWYPNQITIISDEGANYRVVRVVQNPHDWKDCNAAEWQSSTKEFTVAKTQTAITSAVRSVTSVVDCLNDWLAKFVEMVTDDDFKIFGYRVPFVSDFVTWLVTDAKAAVLDWLKDLLARTPLAIGSDLTLASFVSDTMQRLSDEHAEGLPKNWNDTLRKEVTHALTRFMYGEDRASYFLLVTSPASTGTLQALCSTRLLNLLSQCGSFFTFGGNVCAVTKTIGVADDAESVIERATTAGKRVLAVLHADGGDTVDADVVSGWMLRSAVIVDFHPAMKKVQQQLSSGVTRDHFLRPSLIDRLTRSGTIVAEKRGSTYFGKSDTNVCVHKGCTNAGEPRGAHSTGLEPVIVLIVVAILGLHNPVYAAIIGGFLLCGTAFAAPEGAWEKTFFAGKMQSRRWVQSSLVYLDATCRGLISLLIITLLGMVNLRMASMVVLVFALSYTPVGCGAESVQQMDVLQREQCAGLRGRAAVLLDMCHPKSRQCETVVCQLRERYEQGNIQDLLPFPQGLPCEAYPESCQLLRAARMDLIRAIRADTLKDPGQTMLEAYLTVRHALMAWISLGCSEPAMLFDSHESLTLLGERIGMDSMRVHLLWFQLFAGHWVQDASSLPNDPSVTEKRAWTSIDMAVDLLYAIAFQMLSIQVDPEELHTGECRVYIPDLEEVMTLHWFDDYLAREQSRSAPPKAGAGHLILNLVLLYVSLAILMSLN